MAINIPIISASLMAKGLIRLLPSFKQLETTSEKAQFAIKKAAVPAAAALGWFGCCAWRRNQSRNGRSARAGGVSAYFAKCDWRWRKQTAQIEDQISAMSRASGIADTEYRKALRL
jgi:hypothetical protein